jgi:predicted O-methyltransferase YrrM
MTGILLPEQYKYLIDIHPKDNSFAEIKNFALLNKIPIVNDITMRFIEQLLIIKNPKTVLEIGTAIGYSALKIAKIISDKSSVVTIEKSTDNIIHAKNNFEKFDCGKKIKLLEGEAKEILKKIKTQFDFIFLDADKHDYPTLFPDLLNLLASGGIIVIDNLLWKGRVADINQDKKSVSTDLLRKFNSIFMQEKRMISTILSVGDGIGLGIKI